jgi:hypothetical protein
MIHKDGTGPRTVKHAAGVEETEFVPRVSTGCETDLSTAHTSQRFEQHMCAASGALRGPSGLPSRREPRWGNSSTPEWSRSIRSRTRRRRGAQLANVAGDGPAPEADVDVDLARAASRLTSSAATSTVQRREEVNVLGIDHDEEDDQVGRHATDQDSS